MGKCSSTALSMAELMMCHNVQQPMATNQAYYESQAP